MQVTGSSFRNSYMLAEIQQGRLDGHFDINEASRLDFGVAMTEVNNRSAFSNVQQDSWGGATVRRFDDLPGRSVAARHRAAVLRQHRRQQQSEPVQRVLHLGLRDGRGRLAADAGNAVRCTRRIRIHHRPAHQGRLEQRLHPVRDRPSTRRFRSRWPWVCVTRRPKSLRVRSCRRPSASTGWPTTSSRCIFSDPGFTTLEGEYDYVLPSADFAFDAARQHEAARRPTVKPSAVRAGVTSRADRP